MSRLPQNTRLSLLLQSNMKLCLIVFLFSCILSAVICKSCNCKCCSKDVEPDPTTTTEHPLVDFTEVGGLNFMPKPENYSENNTLIRYNPDNSSYFREFMQQYYAKYEVNWYDTANCDHPRREDDTRVCGFKWERFGPCEPPDFGLSSDDFLCIFLDLDKVPNTDKLVENWRPEYYNANLTMPEEMTDELKRVTKLFRQSEDQVWVDCIAKDENGTEVPVSYLQYGFDAYYFPYTKVEGYHNPVVAVHFKEPRSCTVYDFVCRAWAKNLDHGKKQGVVDFQVMFDKNCTTEAVEIEN